MFNLKQGLLDKSSTAIQQIVELQYLSEMPSMPCAVLRKHMFEIGSCLKGLQYSLLLDTLRGQVRAPSLHSRCAALPNGPCCNG